MFFVSHPKDSVRTLPGVGPRRAELLAKLGLYTLEDLLHFFPRTYEDRTRLLTIDQLEAGLPSCFLASVVTNPQTHRIPKPGGKQLEVTKLVVADHTARLHLTFFNAGYSVGKLLRGETYCFYGSLDGDFTGYAMTNPLFEPVDAAGAVTRRILPIYPLTAGLTNRMISNVVTAALDRCAGMLPEPLPPDILNRHQLCGVEAAYREIHNPTSAEALEQARRRLIFEEFFLFSAALTVTRAQRTVHEIPPFFTGSMEEFYAALPFRLTGAQTRAIAEILEDFRSGRPMSRLVQGDVGSGKTVVAAAAAYCTAKNHRQAALMAPTEILARQHFDRLAPLLGSLGLRCVLLTGSMTPAQKKIQRLAIAGGACDLVIGTHALLSESTAFASLGLVIADEQHRFGVAQRAALCAKGRSPISWCSPPRPFPARWR